VIKIRTFLTKGANFFPFPQNIHFDIRLYKRRKDYFFPNYASINISLMFHVQDIFII